MAGSSQTYFAWADTLSKKRNEGVYDYEKAAEVNDLISSLYAVASTDDLSLRCEHMESAMGILTRHHFDFEEEIKLLKHDNEHLKKRISELEESAKGSESLRVQHKKLILGQCAFKFEEYVRVYVTRKLDLSKQKIRLHKISLSSLIDADITQANGCRLTERQFKSACEEWSELAEKISWNDDWEAFTELKDIRLGPAHPPVKREEAMEALTYLLPPTTSHLKHVSLRNFIMMTYSIPELA